MLKEITLNKLGKFNMFYYLVVSEKIQSDTHINVKLNLESNIRNLIFSFLNLGTFYGLLGFQSFPLCNFFRTKFFGGTSRSKFTRKLEELMKTISQEIR